ncbi:fibronectin type III domain-containing protein [Acidovorax sp.]|uniref:IPTL-CTERM sorting domain-containing protein n=1 Tax=Acidovorax sp. TaxID=1872122 RepID=UPI00262BDC70|nr:fibronectin type III domain-containing protein [Acidovorax sp.]
MFTRTGGTADPNSPQTCALQGAALNSGASSVGQAVDTNGCSAGLGLVDGTSYAVVLSASNVQGADQVARYDNGIGMLTYDITPPTVASSTPTVVTDTGADGTLNVGDTLVLSFSEPVLVSQVTLGNLSLNNGHTLSSSTLAANSAVGGYASSFTLTLAGTPTLAVGDTLTIASAQVLDRASNAATANAVFTVPAFVAGTPTGVAATAGNAQATVTWTAPAGNGGSAVTGYRVQLATNLGGPYSDAGGGCLPATTLASTTPSCVASGLSNGTTYYAKVAAQNGVGLGNYSTASTGATPTALVNGVCGTANGVASTFTPSAGLCTAGNASAVTDGSPWAWSCAGTAGGTTASCSAPNTSLPTNNGTGRARLVPGHNWVVDHADSGGFIPTTGHAKSPPNLPPGIHFPYGLFDVKLTGGDLNSSTSLVLTYPANLPPGTAYWKYGPEPGNAAPHWYQYPNAVISGNQITLTLTDGLQGDSDLSGNGVILDPGGPGGVPGGATGIPSLSEWGLLLLSACLGLMGLVFARRSSARGL